MIKHVPHKFSYLVLHFYVLIFYMKSNYFYIHMYTDCKLVIWDLCEYLFVCYISLATNELLP
jgi:hypothetical protein